MVTKVSRSAVAAVVETVLLGAKQATKYLSPQLTVKATRQGARDGRARQTIVLLTIGNPNYAERRFIKVCLKAGEAFPVKKTQATWEKR